MGDKTILLLLFGGYILLMSLLTFYEYGLDKKRAIKGKKRISEVTLLLASFLGGAIGGYLAMKVFRHKTLKEHWYFTTINILSIFCHIAIFVLIIVKI